MMNKSAFNHLLVLVSDDVIEVEARKLGRPIHVRLEKCKVKFKNVYVPNLKFNDLLLFKCLAS